MSTTTTRVKELPEDLVIQILLRVPAIDLLRFRCVCKSWCTLISNHDFISKHLNQSTLNEDTHHLLVHRRDKTTNDYLLNMLSFQSLDVLKTLPVPFVEIDRKIKDINILASCNGVICLEDNWGLDIVLWNPTTRETKIVPKSLPLPPGIRSKTNNKGFGFDAKTNDYKVVQISKLFYNDDDYTRCGYQVYSLRSDSWRKIDASVAANIFYGTWGRLYTNGMFSLYASKGFETLVSFDMSNEVLLGFETLVSFDMSNEVLLGFETLVSFDMSNEVFLTTPLPYAKLFGTLHEIPLFLVRDESVAMVCKGDVTHFEVWVLCEYGVKESWTKVLTVGPFLGIDWPLGFWKNVQVFLRTSEGQLVLYDSISQDIKYLQVDGIPNTIQLTTYMESLVLIKGGNDFEEQNRL